MLTLRICQAGVLGLAAVAAPVAVSRQAPLAVADEGLPVVLHLGVAQTAAGSGHPDVALVQDILDPDDLVHFRLGDVHRLPLLVVVDHGAVRQVEPVRNPAGAAILARLKKVCHFVRHVRVQKINLRR